jgi:hypothetical protein
VLAFLAVVAMFAVVGVCGVVGQHEQWVRAHNDMQQTRTTP